MLRAKRLDLNLSQSEIASRANCGTQFISNIERGLAFPPRHLFPKLMRIYDLNADRIADLILSDIKKTLYVHYLKEKNSSKKGSHAVFSIGMYPRV